MNGRPSSKNRNKIYAVIRYSIHVLSRHLYNLYFFPSTLTYFTQIEREIWISGYLLICLLCAIDSSLFDDLATGCFDFPPSQSRTGTMWSETEQLSYFHHFSHSGIHVDCSWCPFPRCSILVPKSGERVCK